MEQLPASKTVTVVFHKLPLGGVSLAWALDGNTASNPAACFTALDESVEMILPVLKNHFNEPAIRRQAQIPQLSQLRPAQPQQPPRPDQYPPMEDRPAVLDGMDNPPLREPDVSLVERAKRAMDGRNGRERVNAVLFAAFVTLAMAAHSMGLRA